MKRLKLEECSDCGRDVFEDEGKISEYYLGKFGLCRECAEKIMERDYVEMERKMMSLDYRQER
jgi:hypothetical protein